MIQTKQPDRKFTWMAQDQIRNRLGAGIITTAVAASTALVLLGRCGSSSAPLTEGPITPVCGDNVCNDLERYPVKLNKDGTLMKDKAGTNVPNPSYCKIDCASGDNVCDDNPTDVRSVLGDKLTLPKAYRDGKPVPSPMEGPDDIDCRLKLVNDNPCIPGTPDANTPKLTRKMFAAEPGLLRDRTPDELAQMHKDPSSMAPGQFSPNRNEYVVPVGLRETCDTKNALDCGPGVNEECFCASNCPPREAKPQPKSCGNGTIDRGEECDPKSKQARGGCKEGSKCTSSCSCEEVPKGSVCGNNKVEPGEQCDPPGTECGNGGKCNTSCICQAPERKAAACPDTVKTRPLISRASGALNGKAMQLREILGAGDSDMDFRVNIHVTTQGDVSLNGITGSCGGRSCGTSQAIVDTSGVNFSGIHVPGPQDDCNTSFGVTVSKERQ